MTGRPRRFADGCAVDDVMRLWAHCLCGRPGHTEAAMTALLFENPQQLEAECPIRTDHGMSVRATWVPPSPGRSGRMLMYCAGGCPTADLIAGLGLTADSLIDDGPAPPLSDLPQPPRPDCLLCQPDELAALFGRIYGGWQR